MHKQMQTNSSQIRQMWNEYWMEDKVSHGRYGSETPYLTIKKQLHLKENNETIITSKTKKCFTMTFMSKALLCYAQAVQNWKHFEQSNLWAKHWQKMENLFWNSKQFIAIHVVAHNLKTRSLRVLLFCLSLFMFDLFTSVQKFFCWWKNWS